MILHANITLMIMDGVMLPSIGLRVRLNIKNWF
jgi:hypothetical protein